MNYVKTYENVLPPGYCEHIIDKFEEDKEFQVETVLQGHRSFTEININQHESWKDVENLLLNLVQQNLKNYMEDNCIDPMAWPLKFGYEQFRMKRYLPNDKDEIQFHVDVQDHASARRFLVFFFYLNDVAEGGETAFTFNRQSNPHLQVKPEAGKLLVFPPLWTHPHIAKRPISGPKYIIGGYLHYV